MKAFQRYKTYIIVLFVVMCIFNLQRDTFSFVSSFGVLEEGFADADRNNMVLTSGEDYADSVQVGVLRARNLSGTAAFFKGQSKEKNSSLRENSLFLMLDICFKTAFFLSLFISLAIGKDGIVMPFQRLLNYIQSTDGKKDRTFIFV